MSHGRSHRRKPRWGQNFLVNQRVSDGIVTALGELAGHGVIEIGPGQGALTRKLLGAGARIVAVEIDPALADQLDDELGDESAFTLVRGDALAVSWPSLIEQAATDAGPVRLCANLPYESGTHILLDWLEVSAAEPRMTEAVVMLQAEVGDRLVAHPRTKAYGSLAALAQSTHEIRSLMDVAPGSFRPPPKVWSRVIRLRRLASPLFAPCDRARHAKFIHDAFAHRRKQLASDLAGRDDHSREDWQRLLESLQRCDPSQTAPPLCNLAR